MQPTARSTAPKIPCAFDGACLLAETTNLGSQGLNHISSRYSDINNRRNLHRRLLRHMQSQTINASMALNAHLHPGGFSADSVE